jgi:cytochrome oxidase Cu insertion factor (SCO1/SenC/PrrC family)
MADRSPDEVAEPEPASPRRRWLGPLLIGAALGLAVAAVMTLVVSRGDVSPDPPTDLSPSGQLAWDPGERPAPDFTLRDQAGRQISLEALRGRPVVLAFLNSRCTDTCPVEGRQLAGLADVLPPDRRPTVLAVSVSLDDTPTTAARAAEEWGWSSLRWHWLLGDRRALAQVWERYGIQADPADAQEQVVHTGALYLIDAGGDVRSAYTVPVPMPMLVSDIEQVETGKTARRAQAS